jgi:DnaJ family protein A protein 5
VHEFYQKWTNFQTKRTFAFADKYRPSDAENREHRRYLEKENKRIRDSMRKEYNETVGALALFCRKRDPRYLKHQKQQAEARSAALEAKKTRKSNAKSKERTMPSFEEPSWAKIDDLEYQKYFSLHPEDQETGTVSEDDASDESSIEQEYYCDLCSKSFKSEKQYENHEKSKKHIKQLEQHGGISSESVSVTDSEESWQDAMTDQSEYEVLEDALDDKEEEEELHNLEDEMEQLTVDAAPGSAFGSDADSGVASGVESVKEKSKPEKKKRRAKKKEAATVSPSLSCFTCKKEFDSRNSLFRHLKSSKHTAPP